MRSFKEITGFSPTQYIIRLRLEKACHLLSTTTLPVTEIAFHVGFDDSNYFARQFHNVIGLSPSHYRNTHKHPPELLLRPQNQLPEKDDA